MADSKDISFSTLADAISAQDYDYQTIDLSSSITMASPTYTMSSPNVPTPTISISSISGGAYSNTMWNTNTTAGWNGTGGFTAAPSGTITLKFPLLLHSFEGIGSEVCS